MRKADEKQTLNDTFTLSLFNRAHMKSNVFASQTLAKLFLLFFLTAFATGLSAQVRLSVQGLVKKSDGTALPDGNYDLSFRFYNAETGGASLATETVTTEINGGVYSAILGGGGGLDMLPFDVPYYVSVAVDGGTELLPRVALSAAPYAVSLQGASNKFPSTGTVKTDAIQSSGDIISNGNLAANAFLRTGNTASGLFFGGNDVGLQSAANPGQNRLLISGGGTNHYVASGGHFFQTGNVQVDNALTANTLTVNGAASTGAQTVNGDETVNGSQNVTGITTSAGQVRTQGLGNGGGFTFNFGAFQDSDSGLFGYSDGNVGIQANGQVVARFTTPQAYNNNVDNIESSVKFFGIQKGPNAPQVEWDINTGELQVDNSSRRLKRNIVPMEEDFTKILKVQPKYYNRIGYPDSLIEAGYIAEEFDSLGLQPLVHYYANGDIFGISYDRISLYLTEIVKMHHADIAQLKAEVAALTAEKNALRTENASLRADAQSQQADFGKQLDELSRRLRSLEVAASNR